MCVCASVRARVCVCAHACECVCVTGVCRAPSGVCVVIVERSVA